MTFATNALSRSEVGNFPSLDFMDLSFFWGGGGGGGGVGIRKRIAVFYDPPKEH